MLLKKLKEKKVIAAIFGLSLCATIMYGGFSVYAQYNSEKDVEKMFLEETADNLQVEDTDFSELLFKNYAEEEIGRQVCEKYNLDFETISLTDMSDEMLDYSSTLEIAAKSGDQTLLMDVNGDDIIIEDIEKESLELQLDEGYAFGGSGKIIKEYCQSINLDPKNSSIKDLTIDQLFEINELCREASPHGNE